MMKKLTIRTRLVLLVFVTAIPLLAAGVALVLTYSDKERDVLNEQATRTATAAMQAVDLELAAVIAGLKVVAAAPALQEENFEHFHAFAKAAERITGNTAIVLYDRSGRRLVSTATRYGEPLPVRKDMAPIWAAFDTGETHVWALSMSELLKRPTIGVIVPVTIQNDIRYVLGAAIASEALSQLLLNSGLPRNWTTTVIDQNGIVIARSTPENVAGTPVQARNWEKIRSAKTAVGTFEGVARDGSPSTYTFARSTESGWTSVVAIPRSELQAELQKLLYVIGAIGLGLTIALFIAWLLAREISTGIRLLIAPALSLGEGKPVHPVRTGLQETDCVAQALFSASKMLNKAQHDASHDGLTGLPNRVLLNEMLQHHLQLQRRQKGALAVLFIDLDGFKAVNDVHGHAVGDEVLRVVAKRLEGLMRSSDVAARIGGDEFAVMLVDTDAKGAEKVAAYLISKLSTSYDINGISVTGLSASVGIAAYPATGLDGNELVARADEALYRAKANGKRQYAVAAPLEARQASCASAPKALDTDRGASASEVSDVR